MITIKLLPALAVVASTIGIGGVIYLTRLVHADEHTEDREKIAYVITAQSTMQQILNTQLLSEELMRARDLRKRIRDNPADSALEADMLIKTELHIEQLRQAAAVKPRT